jgi:hypothetical protein
MVPSLLDVLATACDPSFCVPNLPFMLLFTDTCATRFIYGIMSIVLQVVRYLTTQYYTEHYDNRAGANVTRHATVLLYLNDCPGGGGTYFRRATGSTGLLLRQAKKLLLIFPVH